MVRFTGGSSTKLKIGGGQLNQIVSCPKLSFRVLKFITYCFFIISTVGSVFVELSKKLSVNWFQEVLLIIVIIEPRSNQYF